MIEIGPNLSKTTENVAIALAVAIGLYFTHNPWCIVGLLFCRFSIDWDKMVHEQKVKP